MEAARELADSIVQVASGAGVKTTALITDMNQVLGRAAGHTTEMREAIDYLTGKRREARLDAGDARAGGGDAAGRRPVPKTAPEAMSRIETALASGRAAEVFGRMVAALGGPNDLLEQPGVYLAPAPVVKPCAPTKSGRIAAIDTRAVGVALIELGGGRRRAAGQDRPPRRISASSAGLGEDVGPQQPICTHSCSGRAPPGRGPPMLSVRRSA